MRIRIVRAGLSGLATAFYIKPALPSAELVMLGGQRNPELANQDAAGLIATARIGIERTMGLAQEPDVTFVKRWDRGIPSYGPGHNDCARNSRELAAHIAG